MSPTPGNKIGQFEVDLALSREPRAFRGKQNLWSADLGRIYRLLDRQVTAVDQGINREDQTDSNESQFGRRSEDEKDHIPHLAIAIFGPSGSGKSSLLRTLADDVRRKRDSILETHLNPRDVATLTVMDPTTWRASDQFLYAFLASALEEERKEQERQDHPLPQGLSPVQLAFQEVNEYLRVLDEPDETSEYDPLGLSLQKLERHTSSLRLRGALERFVDELARSLKAEVVLLPVDDLDMAPHHLVDSLRTYMSFLTHPRLIPVFTMTDRMSEELIEVELRNQLRDGAFMPHSETPTLPISAKMSVQFLARCFPVRNRIRLGPAPARLQRALMHVGHDKRQQQKQEVFELLLTASFLLFGHPDKESSHKVKAALRPSTLRRQFQVVDAMADSRIPTLRNPQLGRMAGLKNKKILKLAKHGEKLEVFATEDDVEGWVKRPEPKDKLVDFADRYPKVPAKPEKDKLWTGFRILAQRLSEEKINATWATIYNGATWSLLNVHRDTLRELGLFLEDLYSWTPGELRSVVVERILAQDRITRRTVLDRWFNRTDYRRSQVLSLLAANIFRPWMPGEEPYGDREGPLLIRRSLEKGEEGKDLDECVEDIHRQVRERLTFPATKGLLWFLNVTVGFYLPQIMAHDWSDAVSPDQPVRGRMSGNGWDLSHAPINAIRIADTKQEIFSFGMMFLEPTGYRHALEAVTYKEKEEVARIDELKDLRKELKKHGHDDEAKEKIKDEIKRVKDQANPKFRAWATESSSWEGNLLLRIWSCSGYSRGRYWAALSIWRGLGFIGQVLELGHRENFRNSEEVPKDNLRKNIKRLIRSHCLNGLAGGSTLSQNTDEEKLLHGFPQWAPRNTGLNEAINELAEQLEYWFSAHRDKVIYPFPAGRVGIGWSDCFVRRVHGDSVLGSLWPRFNATYLEQQHSLEGWWSLANKRSTPEVNTAADAKDTRAEEEKLRWRASIAAGAWSGVLLEHWRGCTPILELLLSCPAFLKSQEYFGNSTGNPTAIIRELQEPNKTAATAGQPRFDDDENNERLDRLNRLGLPSRIWKELEDKHNWELDENDFAIPGLIPDEFCIVRADPEQFAAPTPRRVEVSVRPTNITNEDGSEFKINSDTKPKDLP